MESGAKLVERLLYGLNSKYDPFTIRMWPERVVLLAHDKKKSEAPRIFDSTNLRGVRVGRGAVPVDGEAAEDPAAVGVDRAGVGAT